MKYLLLLLLAIGVLASCELYEYEQDKYQEYYVVESYLVANSPLPDVLLSKTAPIEDEYIFENTAINEAEVEIRLLHADSSIQKRYSYVQGSNGFYYADNPVDVKAQRLYQLHIDLPGGDNIEAKTFVPGNFHTVNRDELSDTYTYQGEERVEITTTRSEYITERQTYYVFTVNAADPDSSNLTPFYADLVEEQDNSIDNFLINSSGIINEENYELNPDNTITLKVPWLSFAFFGGNDIITNAIDDNMYDFLRSQDTQTGGINLAPGEIQNIRYNINGGIGIFGSMASDTNHVQITKPAQ